MILPPAALHLPALQASTPADADWWLKVGAGAVFGFLGSLVAFRTRLYGLKRDIDDEKKARESDKREMGEKFLAVENRIATSVEAIQKSISDRHNSEALEATRGDARVREALNSIRRDNDEHHTENSERLRVMRQQLIAMVQLLAKIARATAGIDQSEVDFMIGRVLTAEVERAD